MNLECMPRFVPALEPGDDSFVCQISVQKFLLLGKQRVRVPLWRGENDKELIPQPFRNAFITSHSVSFDLPRLPERPDLVLD